MDKIQWKERYYVTDRASALVEAGEWILRNAVTRLQNVGDEGSGSTRATMSQKHNRDDMEPCVVLTR